jgi:D-alanyl-D-alanine carboxypeptidase/D-alanyl-D-alanine-endopeptidase (penicillin-binding protein 4)
MYCQQVLGRSELKDGLKATVIKDISSDSILFQHNANLMLSPASILKLITASHAIRILDKNFTFKTKMELRGISSEEILTANILVKGGGDPTLGGKLKNAIQLSQIANDIEGFLDEYKVSCLDGSIIVDASHFNLPAYPDKYLCEDMANYYGAGLYGLNVNENAYTLTFNRRGKNQKAPVTSFDELAIDRIINQVMTKGNRDNAYVFFTPDPGIVVVKGTIPEGRGSFSIKGAIPNPPLYFAKSLENLLFERGVDINSSPHLQWTAEDKNTGDVLWQKEYASPELSQLLPAVLHQSNNLIAQALFKEMLRKADFKQYLSDLEDKYHGAKIADGNGLSPSNKISCKLMIDELEFASKAKWFKYFESQIARNGLNGTVRSFLKDQKGKLLIKSGSSSEVIAYAGYFKTSDNRIIAFCLIANELQLSKANYRKAWEDILKKVAEL